MKRKADQINSPSNQIRLILRLLGAEIGSLDAKPFSQNRKQVD
jgi:hypothetical protein